MPTDTHPLDAPPSHPLVAALILIVGLGVLALGAHVHPRSGSVQGSSTAASDTDTVVEWGD